MAVQIDCPDVEQLRQLMLGQVRSGDAESLGEHLLHCARCAETVHSLDATDPLVQAARAAAAEHPESSLIVRLMSRLQRQQPPQPVIEIEATVETTTLRRGGRIG